MRDVPVIAAFTSHAAWHTWSLEPGTVAGIVLAGAGYALGVRRLWSRRGPGRGIRPWQAASFGLGLAAVLAALVSPLDAAADNLLSAHMAQHLLLLTVAAPLLVLGRPGVAGSAALGPDRRRALHRLGRPRWIGWGRRTMAGPVAAWLISATVLWAWHVPGLYEAAIRRPEVHVLEHASFLGSGLLFWWVALQPSGPRRLRRGADVLFVITGALQSGALGAMFAFASSPVYRIYAQRTAAWGASPLADQQLAGLLMWVPSFFVYLAAAAGLFVAWLRAAEREDRRVEERSSRLLATTGRPAGGM